ncbi:MAG: DUF5685 family protein [Clostridiaceae bacterium]
MFGYVTPCKMELKMKDYEKFRAYYCGLCKSIKSNIGNIPRFALNYDMTFLAILLDSLSETRPVYLKQRCLIHPLQKKVIVADNNALEYAAYFNTILSYYKLVDNYTDEGSIKSKLLSAVLKPYIINYPDSVISRQKEVENKLNELSDIEASPEGKSFDEVSQPFADLTGYVLASYMENENDDLYWLGYNLGKWIYIIDAFDDLEKDMKARKFNAIEAALNTNSLDYEKFREEVADRVEFVLTTCASQCVICLDKLKLKKNSELLHNILQYGLMEKIDKVFKRSCYNDEKSL